MQERLGHVAYSASATTTSSSGAVLQRLEREAVDQGLEIRDRAPSYVNLAAKRSVPGGTAAATVAGIAILLIVLGLTAISPLFIVCLPLALLPVLPFAVGRGDSVTVAAFEAGDKTLVTADGRSTAKVGQVIDDFIAELNGTKKPSGTVSKPSSGPMKTPLKPTDPPQ